MENNVELNNIKLDNTGVNTPGTVGVDANTQQTQGDKSAWDIYTKKTHVIGRTVSIITLVMLVGAPFLIGKLLGAYPDLGGCRQGVPLCGNRMAGQQHRRVFDLHTDAGSRRRIPGIYHR